VPLGLSSSICAAVSVGLFISLGGAVTLLAPLAACGVGWFLGGFTTFSSFNMFRRKRK
jgi:hypothetical protein